MAQVKNTKRLSKIAREFNVGISTIIDFLEGKNIELEANPNTKVSPEIFEILEKEFCNELIVKQESEKLELGISRAKKEILSIEDSQETDEKHEETKQETIIDDDTDKILPEKKKETEKKDKDIKVKIVGKIDIVPKKEKIKTEDKETKTEDKETKIKDKETEKKPGKKKKVEVQEEKIKETTESLLSPKIEKDVKVVGKIDLTSINQKTRPPKKSKLQKEKERKKRELERITAKKKGKIKPEEIASEQISSTEIKEETKKDIYKSKIDKLSGPTVVGKIKVGDKKESNIQKEKFDSKKKRKRIRKDKVDYNKPNAPHEKQKAISKKHKYKTRTLEKKEISEEDVQQQIKDTLARLTAKGKSKGVKHRREKREQVILKQQEKVEATEKEKNIIKITEFVTVNEMATMMDVPVNDVIAACMNLGLFVSINQRLDAETMSLVAEEFDFKVEFVSTEVISAIKDDKPDDEKSLQPRPPIVTVMGHVDHGKTSLLDHIRKTNVIAGEAGGITQHIGAYSVVLDNEKKITFLDTPGHEAFTAMRARGAQVTDLTIIVIAADDNVMPQTVEAINHAHAAGVPIVFAINKIDKPGANPEKIKEELANMNFLVEDWGGKYQSQEISAKQGTNIDELLEKVLLESEMLELKANPNKKSVGTIIESTLDKGRGYVATILVKAGTLSVGDIILAGSYFGHIKAMYNERGNKIDKAGPSSPVLILGLNGAPQAGDNFNTMESDKEAKEIANKREQLQREQGLRTQKHITLDEIGRRIAIGNFQELNVIIKGDVDGSIEALSDSLIKLSTDEIVINIIHKAVGQISESDVLLAAASNAIIIGFQVRPSMNARKLAEKEEIEIRLYSIIYNAINELKDAMEGMLSPEIKEKITATIEIREVFKITKVGNIAGCIVKDGKITRNAKIRVIREGIVVYTGELGSLKRFKDDVKEVASGYECGLNIEKYNDIKVGDILESYTEVEVKRTL
ncbi:MAG: translation initiation factor IF-2 [Bacteroidales bacterium]|nr:translation initiation factor IF-2 [Bacteroidales bacterium]